MGIKKNSNTMFIIIITAVMFMAVVPVYILSKKVDNINNVVTPEIAGRFKTDKELDIPAAQSGVLRQGNRVGAGFVNTGAEIIFPSRQNMHTFGDRDFHLLGAAPWGLLLTVEMHAQDADMVRYVFNQPAVSDGFMERADIKNLLGTPEVFYVALKNEPAVSRFLNNEAMLAALEEPKVIEAVAKSRLMYNILNTPAVQYFIKNPNSLRDEVINKSPSISALKKNPAIVKAVRENKQTGPIASIILR